MHAIGAKEGPPIPPLNLVADYGGGSMFLIFGILAALYERVGSGMGQVIDVAMVDGVASMMSVFHSAHARGDYSNKRASNMLDGGAPYYRCYQTSDRKYLSVGPIETKFFAEFVNLVGLPKETIGEQNVKELWGNHHKLLESAFREKTLAEWSDIFKNSDSCVVPIIPISEVMNNDHNRCRGSYITIDEVLQPSPAPRFERTPASVPNPPIGSGQSNREILSNIGFSDKEIDIISSEVR